ncbi:hypothetical protein FWK35_00038349 [Aphis craccivora]|uniref:Uncharacterized protein n=1 Tax=Aphis craccivora TaxID=307492 RepID=A0A6G0Z125_APHCR|nr:hypothetical protein FWK35_00038349 [Aphis craccivora]
MGVVTWPPPRR